MDTSNVATIVVALLASAGLAWFFFGPKRSSRAELRDGVQVVTVTVKGGYSPDLVQVRRGTPVQLLFDRQESGDCSSRVLIPDFAINESLPAGAVTAVEFVPQQVGEFGFACGMNMLHGRIQVVDDPIGHPYQVPDELAAIDGRDDISPSTADRPRLLVRAGFHPSTLSLPAGTPAIILVERHESSPCSQQLRIEAAGILVDLPDDGTVEIEVPPLTAGEYDVVCGMGMQHARLLVGAPVEPSPIQPGAAGAPDDLDSEAAERRAEVRDLTRRVVWGRR